MVIFSVKSFSFFIQMKSFFLVLLKIFFPYFRWNSVLSIEYFFLLMELLNLLYFTKIISLFPSLFWKIFVFVFLLSSECTIFLFTEFIFILRLNVSFSPPIFTEWLSTAIWCFFLSLSLSVYSFFLSFVWIFICHLNSIYFCLRVHLSFIWMCISFFIYFYQSVCLLHTSIFLYLHLSFEWFFLLLSLSVSLFVFGVLLLYLHLFFGCIFPSHKCTFLSSSLSVHWSIECLFLYLQLSCQFLFPSLSLFLFLLLFISSEWVLLFSWILVFVFLPLNSFFIHDFYKTSISSFIYFTHSFTHTEFCAQLLPLISPIISLFAFVNHPLSYVGQPALRQSN